MMILLMLKVIEEEGTANISERGGLEIAAKSWTSRFKNKISRFDVNSFKEFIGQKKCCNKEKNCEPSPIQMLKKLSA